MKKVYLVRPVCSTISEPELPLNLMILGACLEEIGYKPQILDYDVIKVSRPEIVKTGKQAAQIVALDIVAKAPDCVFFTCMCSNFARTISIIKELKKLEPNIFVGIGGPHVSMCASDTIDAYHKYIDVIMIGEGEKTIVELLRGIENNDISKVKGICYYKDGIRITEKRELLKDLDDSPIPAYHLVKMDDYGNMTGKTNVYIGSGCPFGCNFCTTSLMWQRRYRAKSVERVIKELKILVNEYKKTDFVFIHDNLTANRQYAVDLINGIKKSGLKIEYEISSRIDTIDKELIQLFAESGGKTIFFGIESGSERMQQVIGKKLKLNRVHEILDACKKNNIYAAASFIIGFPEETEDDLEKTVNLSFMCRTTLEDQIGMNLLSIYPGSPLSESAYNDLYLDEINYEFPMYQGLSEDEIIDIKTYKSIYIHYYLYKNYSNGLTPIEMRKLFDYVTIVLEKYPYTFNYLLNILHLSFIDIFKKENYTMDKLTLEDKDRYNYQIDEQRFIQDIEKLIDISEIIIIKEWLAYDISVDKIYRLSIDNKDRLFYNTFSLNVDFTQNIRSDDKQYSIIVGKNGEVYDIEISYDIYNKIKTLDGNPYVLEKYLKETIGLEMK